MITAISVTHTTYTTSTPGNPGAQAETAGARDRELRAAPGSDNTATQSSSQQDSTSANTSGLPAEQRVSASQRSSDVDQRVLNELAARDREVRNHERAHQAAGGNLTGSASYVYQQGPDGQRYAIGGEVSIQAPVRTGDPQDDLANAQTILRAALAPAEPSTQDLRVAASARSLVASAQAELLEARVDEVAGRDTVEGDTQRSDAAERRGDGVANSDRSEDVDQALQGTRSDRAVHDGVDSFVTESGGGDEQVLSVADRFEQRLAEREQNLALLEQRQSESERRAERITEYQQNMAELHQRLAEVNQMLAQSGVLDVEYLVGSYINDNA